MYSLVLSCQMSISGIIDTLSNAFTKAKKTERQEFLKRLHGYSTSQLANVVLAILVGSTVEMSIGNVPPHLRGCIVVIHVTSCSPHECAQCLPGDR